MEKKVYPFSDLGEELRLYRGDMSKKAFAALLEVGIQTYYRYETGERQVPAGILKKAQTARAGSVALEISPEPGLKAKEGSVIWYVDAVKLIFERGSPETQAVTRMVIRECFKRASGEERLEEEVAVLHGEIASLKKLLASFQTRPRMRKEA